jgi:hypothetical protein
MAAARDAGLPNDPEFRSAFGSYIEWGSRLAVENSQAGAKPPAHMPMPRWDWHTAAEPPGPRVSALAPPGREDEPEPLWPAADETPRFERHIRPLFRRGDRQSMSFAFDLWSHDDVSQHARPSSISWQPAPCPVIALGRRRKSTSSDAGSRRADQPEPMRPSYGQPSGSRRGSGRRAAFSGRSAST